MRKPGGTIAILFGAPSRFADEHDEPADEDHLQREQDSDALDEIYQRLCDDDQQVVQQTIHFATGLGRCLISMAHAARRGDEVALRDWYRRGRKLSEDQEENQQGDERDE
jgi:hypothetical protein